MQQMETMVAKHCTNNGGDSHFSLCDASCVAGGFWMLRQKMAEYDFFLKNLLIKLLCEHRHWSEFTILWCPHNSNLLFCFSSFLHPSNWAVFSKNTGLFALRFLSLTGGSRFRFWVLLGLSGGFQNSAIGIYNARTTEDRGVFFRWMSQLCEQSLFVMPLPDMHEESDRNSHQEFRSAFFPADSCGNRVIQFLFYLFIYFLHCGDRKHFWELSRIWAIPKKKALVHCLFSSVCSLQLSHTATLG